MKKIANFHFAIIILVTLLFPACEKSETAIQKPPTNTKPVANAGEDARIRLPNHAILDGSASTDGEHNIVSYKWALGAGPSTATIINPNSAKTEVKFLDKGVYRFDLIVTDSGDRASGDFVKVVVLDTQRLYAAKDTTILLPFNRALLEVTGDDIADLNLKWKKISGPDSFKIESPNSAVTAVSELVAGAYQFEISTINSTLTTVKDTTTITVLPDNNIYTSEKLFENLKWVDNYSTYSISLDNILSIVPSGSPFQLYVRPNNYNWEIASPYFQGYTLFMYKYSITNNVLKVYYEQDDFWPSYPPANTAIKIVY